LPGVDQDQLAVFERGDLDPVETGDRGAVAGVHFDLADADLPARRYEVEVAVGRDVVSHGLARLHRRAENARLGADRQRVVAFDARGERDELAGAILLREGPRAPGRLAAAPLGDDPDLEDPGGLVLEVVFGMLDAGAGRHDLHVAGFGAARVAQAVLVGDRPAAHVGDDLHVAVRVRREAGLRRDFVVVPNPKLAPVGAGRIVVVGEREVMLGVEPAVVSATEARIGTKFDHGPGPR